MNDCTCPYCGLTMDDPVDCYESDVIYEHECPHCEKNFIFTVGYIRTYHENKADCLNGGEHDYRKTDTYPSKFTILRCTMCGDEKPLSR